MKTIIYAFALTGLILNCSTAGAVAQNETVNSVVDQSQGEGDPIGTWEITTSTPRGKRSGVLRIVEEDGKLIGYGEKGNFEIMQEGNVLSWSSTTDSPRGTISLKNRAEISGNRMTGSAEMLSGPMSGRSLSFSGVKAP